MQIVLVLVALLLIAFVVRYNWIGTQHHNAAAVYVRVLDTVYDERINDESYGDFLYYATESCLAHYESVGRWTKVEKIKEKVLEIKRLFRSNKPGYLYIDKYDAQKMLTLRNELADYIGYKERDERIGTGLTL